MFQLSKITLFLQKANELTGIRDHPAQGARRYRSQGKWCIYPREGLETVQSHFHNVLCGSVVSKSLVVLTGYSAYAEPVRSSARLRQDLPCMKIPGWGVKTRNRTLSHRRMFCQTNPVYQPRNFFRFSILPSSNAIICLLPSLTFMSFVQLGLTFGAELVVGLCLAQRLQTWAGTSWLPLGKYQFSTERKIQMSFVLCSPTLVLPEPSLEIGPSACLSSQLCSAFSKPHFWLHSHQLVFSEAANRRASSARISVREVSLDSLQKEKMESWVSFNTKCARVPMLSFSERPEAPATWKSW